MSTTTPAPAGETGSGTTSTVVFFHAHPDDEAIFTGGTMRLLADAGHRVVLVVATRGEEGIDPDGGTAADLAARREEETRRAAAILGAGSVHVLGYRDSGVGPEPAPGTFATTPVDEAAARLAAILRAEGATAVVAYDGHGIYGHPDHVQVARVGERAAALAGLACRYEATVDREYLHFVETHLVEEAGRSVTVPLGPPDDVPPASAASLHGPPPGAVAGAVGRVGAGELGLAGTTVGLPSVLVDVTVDVRAVLDVKRRAMLAHASQIPPSSSALRLSPAAFAEVYGFEWYARPRPPGPPALPGPLEGLPRC